MEGNNFFANDGSFLERFKQLQEQASADTAKGTGAAVSPPATSPAPAVPSPGFTLKKASFIPSGLKTSSQDQKPASTSGSKLAFSLKQKTRSIVNPLKLGEEEDEVETEERIPSADQEIRGRKMNNSSASSAQPKNTIPSPPSDPEIRKVAEKLAQFVAKNGRQFEDLTRKKNPGDTPFRFLYDVNCSDYKYYSYCLSVEEKALGPQSRVNGPSSVLSSRGQSPKKGSCQNTNYQTPASALYSGIAAQQSRQPGGYMEAGQEPATNVDSLSMMEFYMQKAAVEDMRKPSKRSREDLASAASQQPSPPAKRGHHMGDYIPPEELERFLAKCTDAQAQTLIKEAQERAKIQPDNVGHKLLSKMGWKEGQGLGSGRDGRADPVEAGSVKTNNLGVGAVQPGEVTADDDIYEQYKKRMMLGYRYRPNPLNNPRKAYY